MQLELELLAPAKNKDIGIAAIDCGADAVYIAGPAFGAREAAGNSMSDIADLAKYAHFFGAKVYITVNTIFYDSEKKHVSNILKEAYEAGCDAAIIQDLGILELNVSPLPLFASTQCNIRTPEQARFLESLGFKRLILARELSLEQIREIRKATSCGLETFVHGALCVSYSGQCYMSQFLTGRSANRGCCAQLCRSRYDLTDESGKVLLRNKAVLSLKDLSLASHIEDLIEAGVSSFKIEGRLKNGSYVKNIVRYYRGLIDNYIRDNSVYRKSSLGEIKGGFIPDPQLTFSRGYTDFFIDGKRGEWSSMWTGKGIGEEVGSVSKIITNDKRNCIFHYFTKNGVKYPIANGDGLCFLAPSGNVVGMRVDIASGNTLTVKHTPELTVGAVLYRNFNQVFERELEKNTPKRLIAAKVNFVAKTDSHVCKVSDGENLYHVYVEATAEDGVVAFIEIDEILFPAHNRKLTEENIHNQFGKNADHYSFSLNSIKADSLPFIQLSRLNTIRRELALLLDKQRDENRNETAVSTNVIGSGIIPPVQKDKLNCSNRLSRVLYKNMGINAAPAYELEPNEDMELMRSKYCIRYELGMCPKQFHQKASPLFLLNNGMRFEVGFDCGRCEMYIKCVKSI